MEAGGGRASKGEAAHGPGKEQGPDRPTHRLRLTRIEEGDWVLVYDSSLDNQHKAMRKFVKRWFGPYIVTSANNNDTYHLAELDGMRLAVPVAGKRIKVFQETT